MFGDETEEEKLANEKRAQELASQQKKKVVIGKSSVILDIKPYDGETGMFYVPFDMRSRTNLFL